MQATLLFQTIFDQMAEPRIVVRPDAPKFTVVTANKAYLTATGTLLETLSGKSIWDLFKADIAGANARSIFEEGLNDTIRHRAEIKLPIFRFDIAAAQTQHAKARWWQVDINPVNGDDNELVYLICTTRNVTLHVEDRAAILKSEHENTALLIRQQEQTDEAERTGKRTQALSDSEYRLSRIVESTPIGLSIIKGSDLIIETVNDPLLRLWGRKKENVLGKELLKVFPELQDQPFVNLLKQVLDTGKGVRLDRQPAFIILPDGGSKDVFVDFSYDPLFDDQNRADAVLVTVNDVTVIVKAQQMLQEREEELEVMNEELTATNEELATMNEELQASNEELAATNEELQKLRDQ